LFFGVTTDVFAVLLGEEGVELGFLDLKTVAHTP
jgi:hypothetical protein